MRERNMRRAGPYEKVPLKVPAPRCMVRGCEAEGVVSTEPIYAAKVDRPFASENMVVCASRLCHEHARLLSWSI